MKKNLLTVKRIFYLLKTRESSYWQRKQIHHSLDLFQKSAKRIPAYKSFLKKNKINPDKIKTWKDFETLPKINKKNYLTQFPLNELCWDGKLFSQNIFTSTSGSTGRPFYFIRNQEVDWRCSIFIEDFIRAGNEKDMPTTLCIVCFGMGVWIGGLITYKALEQLAIRNNFPLSIITPGINKQEIINILKEISPYYDQILLAGYPPFIKDVIDEAEAQNINLKDKKIKIKFAAEAISEGLRDYIAKKTHMSNFYLDTINVYGSAEIGAMAVENATCILIKRLINGNEELFREIFSPINRVPTLAQYNPYFVNFESNEGNILFTGDSRLPLIRYAIGDRGGVMNFDEMILKLKLHGIDLIKEAKGMGLSDYIYRLPFVYVYERDDLSTSFYGLWIYPEWIRSALLSPIAQQYLTGKFTMTTRYDARHNQFIELNIELKKGKVPIRSFTKLIQKKIVISLQDSSSEYTEIVNHFKERAYPIIKFWSYEDLMHFKPGIKQKWVKK